MRSLNCYGCGKIVTAKDILLTINASAGPRLNLKDKAHPLWSWSPYPTTTANVAVCRDCLEQPAMAPILELISPPLSEVATTAGKRCVMLCRGRGRPFWFAGLRRRMHFWPAPGAFRCPGCGRMAVLYAAPLAPDRYARELAELTKTGNLPTSVNVLRRRPAPMIQGVPEDE